MFSFIPPVITLNTDKISENIITAYRIHHSVVNSAGYRSKGEMRQGQTHCIFHYTIKGSGEVLYNGKSYKTKAGEGFFNIIDEKNSGYGFYEGATEPWEFVVISFRGGNVREIVKELLEKKVVYSIESMENFCLLCKRLLEEDAMNLKLTFFPRLLSVIYETDSSDSPITQKFKSIAEREILNNPSVSTIAYEMNISREHLQREFSKENNITPAKYLKNKRFEKLCYLLTTEQSEKEVSEIMNFTSLSDMIIFFKKISGITPKQYRKNGYITM